MTGRRSFVQQVYVSIGVLIAVATAGALFALGPAGAGAVVPEPIPADAQPGPPQPIPTLPEAGEAPPPADVIGDPMEPDAGCSGWYLQSS